MRTGLRVSDVLSPSSRRAWIEIKKGIKVNLKVDVALLAEGVDRNRQGYAPCGGCPGVALLAEGVDRNRWRTAT